MFRWFRTRLGAKRDRRMGLLLRVFGERPEAYRQVEELAKDTGLGPAVYALLAELDRRGLVERRWLEHASGSRLAYRLNAAGLALLGESPAN